MKLQLEAPVQEEWVTFFNGKVSRNRPAPWFTASFRDQYGRVVKFKELPLHKVKVDAKNKPISDGKGGFETEVDLTTTTDGKTIAKTWDQNLDFTGGRRSLRLHKVVHEEVIQAIRDMNTCVSSKKTEGLKEVKIGRILEHEPEVKLEKDFTSAMNEIEAMGLVGKLIEKVNEPIFYYLTATLGLVRGSDADKVMNITKVAKATPDKFIAFFDKSAKELTLKKELIEPAIITLALGYGVITSQNGLYMLNDMKLGTDKGRIHIDYNKEMGLIKAALDKVVSMGETKKSK